MINTILLISVIIFISIFTLISGFGAAPTVPTPKKVVERMISEAKIRKGRIYYDLGAGDGRIIKSVAKNHGIGIGFEYTPTTYLYAKLKNRDKRIKIFWKNFYKQSYKHVSGIFCFLSPHAMQKLEKKFEEELQFGTKVISYAFALPDRKPNKIIKLKKYSPIYVYEY